MRLSKSHSRHAKTLVVLTVVSSPYANQQQDACWHLNSVHICCSREIVTHTTSYYDWVSVLKMVTSKASQPDNSQSTVGQTPRYAAFNSTKVLICGYAEDVVTALCLYVEREGGKVWKKYYKGARPDVIICGDVSHSSCKVGCKYYCNPCCNSRIPMRCSIKAVLHAFITFLFSSVAPCVIQEARRVWLDAVPVVTATWVEACAKRKAQASPLQTIAGITGCCLQWFVLRLHWQLAHLVLHSCTIPSKAIARTDPGSKGYEAAGNISPSIASYRVCCFEPSLQILSCRLRLAPTS